MSVCVGSYLYHHQHEKSHNDGRTSWQKKVNLQPGVGKPLIQLKLTDGILIYDGMRHAIHLKSPHECNDHNNQLVFSSAEQLVQLFEQINAWLKEEPNLETFSVNKGFRLADSKLEVSVERLINGNIKSLYCYHYSIGCGCSSSRITTLRIHPEENQPWIHF